MTKLCVNLCANVDANPNLGKIKTTRWLWKLISEENQFCCLWSWSRSKGDDNRGESVLSWVLIRGPVILPRPAPCSVTWAFTLQMLGGGWLGAAWRHVITSHSPSKLASSISITTALMRFLSPAALLYSPHQTTHILTAWRLKQQNMSAVSHFLPIFTTL